MLVAQSEGPHELLRGGAALIRNPQDVLDALFGAGNRAILDPGLNGLRDEQRALLEAIRVRRRHAGGAGERGEGREQTP